MDDPNLSRSVTLRAGRFRPALAWMIGLVTSLTTTVALADDQQAYPANPRAELIEALPAPSDSAPSYRAGGEATYPELSWFGGALPLVPADRPYLLAGNGSTPLPSTTRPTFQLVNLQDPSDAPPDAPEEPAGYANANANQQGSAQQRYGKEPVENTLQFLRNTDVLLDPGSWQFDIGFNYTLFDVGFPAAAIDAGTGNVTDVFQGVLRQRLFYSPFALRYGLTKNVQFFAALPAGYTDTQTSTFGSSITSHDASLGDTNWGFNVHLCKAEFDYPDVIATIGCTTPTGNYVAPVDVLVPGLGLGQGFWAINGQLTMIHRYDPVILFYGGGYRHLFAREFGSVLADGTPNTTFFAAGEQINYQVGTGFSANDRVTFSAAFQGLYVTNTRVDHATIRGSNLEPLSMRFAATISRRCKILEPYVSIGLTPSAPAASMGLTITYY